MPEATENTVLTALVKLLDEPDEQAFRLISDRILIHGSEAIAPLEKLLENNFNSLVQDRCQALLHKLSQSSIYRDFHDWLNNDPSDLLKGYIHVSKTGNPGLDAEEVTIRIEQMKMDIWIELHEELTALENIKVMNHLLFEVHRFGRPAGGDVNAPVNCYIDSLLTSKKGSPLALGILYIILAQRLGMPVYGVNLPVNFIVAYLTANGIENPGEKDVLFYVDPYHGGSFLTRKSIEDFVRQIKIRPDTSYFTPCDNREIIRQLINNLIYFYRDSDEPEKGDELDHLLNAYE